jgi:hypothetical protein
MSLQKIRDRIGKEIVKPQCPYCDAKFVYYRKRTDDFQCRSCGSNFQKGKVAKLGVK